jgi:hypothetical protein
MEHECHQIGIPSIMFNPILNLSTPPCSKRNENIEEQTLMMEESNDKIELDDFKRHCHGRSDLLNMPFGQITAIYETRGPVLVVRCSRESLLTS